MENKKKITFFLPTFDEGGVEKVTINLARDLKSKDWDIEFVCFRKQGAYLSKVIEEFNIHELNVTRSSESISKLIKFFKSNKPDVFISAKHYINTTVLIAKALSGIKMKVVVAGHGMFFKRRGLLPFLMRLLYPKADAIVAVSQGVAKNIHEITRIPLDEIKVIHNPVITKEVKELYKKTIPIEKPPGQKLIVSIGRLAPEKDFKTLVTAFKKIHLDNKLKLMIIGEGPERKNLEELIHQLDLRQDVLLPGFKDNPYEYLKAADLFVLSSITEGLPTVLIEALFSETPIVSTDCPSGPNEILESGKYGTLVPVRNPDELAKAIEDKLYQKETDTLRLRKRSLDFTSEIAIKNYQQLIESLLTQKSR